MIRKRRPRAGTSSESLQLRDLVRTAMDYTFYVLSYPELAHLNPQEAADHFLDTGWAEGRQPCEWFDTAFYVAEYPEVVASGQNPFLHYLIYGRAEGRRPFRADDSRSVTVPRDAVDLFVDPVVQQNLASTPAAVSGDFATGSPELTTWSQLDHTLSPEDIAASMDFGYTRRPANISSPIAVLVENSDSQDVVSGAIELAVRLTTGSVHVLGTMSSLEHVDHPRAIISDTDPTWSPLAQLGSIEGLDAVSQPVVVMAASVDPSVNSVSILVDTLRRTGLPIVGAPVHSSKQLAGPTDQNPLSPVARRLRQVENIDERFFCVASDAVAVAKGIAEFDAAVDFICGREHRVMLQGTVFAAHEAPSVIRERGGEHDGRHVLVVDAEWPTPDRDAGSLYTVNIVRLLLDLGHQVSFASDSLTTDLSRLSYLQSIGVRCVYATDGEVHGSRFEPLPPPDVVFLFRYAVARSNHHEMRLRWPGAKFVFHSLDLHGLRQLREAEELNSQRARNAAKRIVADELLLFEEFDAATVVSTYERDFVNARIHSGEAQLLAIPVETPNQQANFRGTANICFVGSFRHPPNVDAVRFIVSEVMPLIHAQRPDAVLHIVGQDLTAGLRPTSEDVIYHGFVPDLDEFLASMDVSLAALRYGAGIKGKVLSSLAAGLPVVGTPVAFEGMGVEHRLHALVGETARELADGAVEVLGDEATWLGLAEQGLALVQESFSMKAVRCQLEESLRAAGVGIGEASS